jgi:hypothetical protein
VTISGAIALCSDPSSAPIQNVTLTLTGDAATSAQSDASGNYVFGSLPSGGNYTVTPSKAALRPGTSGSAINTIDLIVIQRHILQIVLLTGCRLQAADVNGDGLVNMVDFVAVQRFFVGAKTGTANVGEYYFMPLNRTYSGIVTDQTGQDYEGLVFGDVIDPYVTGPSNRALGGTDALGASEKVANVAMVALPNVAVDSSKTAFTAEVVTSMIDPRNNLVGFQGDIIFDSSVVSFKTPPVEAAGLTGTNWQVSANILPGSGPIRTLRVSAVSLDFTPLSGSGTLFELRMTRVGKPDQVTQLLWAMPPDHFLFIDTDLIMHRPSYIAPGSIAPDSSSDQR